MYVVKLPRLGQTMESGIITAWHVAEGAEFDEGQLLYDVETEKMTSEVEAKQSGRMIRIVAPLNEDLPVGTVLAIAEDAGEHLAQEDIDKFLRSHGGTIASRPESETDTAANDSAPEQPPRVVAPSRPKAVPKARHLAKLAGIDLRTTRGTGINGTIRVADLSSAAILDAAPAYVGPPRVASRTPLRGVTKSMSDAVSRSWNEIPQFVQQVNLDATALQARLKRLRYEGTHVTYTDLLISAVAQTAAEVPDVNATFGSNEIIRFSDINVCFAVAADRGLVVPVVHQADKQRIGGIAQRTAELASKAKEGRLTREDASGGTITVSNLGAFGVDTGTPLVNAPQAAIVFVGSMREEAVVVDGRITAQTRLNISAAYDHRIVDGMTGARFISALKQRLESGG